MANVPARKVEARETLDRVFRDRERVIVRPGGKDVAALVPTEDLAALEELEDRQDAKDFRAAKRQWQRYGKKIVPWDQLKADLGLTFHHWHTNLISLLLLPVSLENFPTASRPVLHPGSTH